MFCATRQRSKAEYEATYLVRRMMAVVIVVAILPLIAAEAAGQALFPRDAPKEPGARSWALERVKLPSFDPPRMPDGTPDLRGRWAGTPGGDDIEEHDYVDISSPPEETFISDPPGGRIPYQPWALAKRAEHRAGLGRGWPGESGQRLYADPQTFCLYAVPRATYRGGFEILQGPGYVLMMFNFGHYSRYIPTDGRPHRVSDRVKLWMGNSRGTMGRQYARRRRDESQRQELARPGGKLRQRQRPCDRALHVAAANIIDYEVTIEDPTVFTRPWKIRLPFRARGCRGKRPVHDRDVGERVLRRQQGPRRHTRPRIQVVLGGRAAAVTGNLKVSGYHFPLPPSPSPVGTPPRRLSKSRRGFRASRHRNRR